MHILHIWEHEMEFTAAQLQLAATALAAGFGAASSLALMRFRLRQLEQRHQGAVSRIARRIRQLAAEGSARDRRIVQIEKEHLSREQKLMTHLRTMEREADERFVTTREYSLAVADLRRQADRIERSLEVER